MWAGTSESASHTSAKVRDGTADQKAQMSGVQGFIPANGGRCDREGPRRRYEHPITARALSAKGVT